MTSALTSSIDVAQVVLYAFWAFFFGLIYWLRMEDRREGYPLESDNPRHVGPTNQILIPSPKTFIHPGGHTTQAPNFARDARPINAERSANAKGSPLVPTGNPMLGNIGPASYAQREDEPELTRDGQDSIVPMRVATPFSVSAGPDPRGWDVVATDGKVAGTVKDIWVDRADAMVRYLEVELAGAATGTRLLPITMLRLRSEPRKVEVTAVRAEHFADVPALRSPDRVTLLEEDQIQAFYAGGRLYAEPKRLGPVV